MKPTTCHTKATKDLSLTDTTNHLSLGKNHKSHEQPTSGKQSIRGNRSNKMLPHAKRSNQRPPPTIKPPPPPRNCPTISERVSMLQMASLLHTGYKPKRGVSLVLPDVPPHLARQMTNKKEGGKKHIHRSFMSKKKKKNESSQAQEKSTGEKKISKQRIRFLARGGKSTLRDQRSSRADKVWDELLLDGM